MTLSTILLAGVVMLGGAAADVADPEMKPPTEAESEALLRTILKHQADHRARCLENIHVEFEFSYVYERGMVYSALGADDGPAKDIGTGVRIRQGPNRYLENQSVRVFTRNGQRLEGRFFGVVNAEYVARARVGLDGVMRVTRIDHTDPARLSERAKANLIDFDAPPIFEMGYSDGLLPLSETFEAAMRQDDLRMTARRLKLRESGGTHEIRIDGDGVDGLSIRIVLDANRGFHIVALDRDASQGSWKRNRLGDFVEFVPGCWFPRTFERESSSERLKYSMDVSVTEIRRPDPLPETAFALDQFVEGHEKATLCRFFLSGKKQWYKREAGRWVPTDEPAYMPDRM